MTSVEPQGGDPAVLVERVESSLLVTINRPKVRNAMNSEASEIISEALERTERDNSIRSLIITGAGELAFCAGADLGAVSRGESINVPGHEDWSFAGFVHHPISKPTIAAVNGAAMGGGLEIVLACDLVVASANAKFGLTEVRRGVVAGGGGAFRLPSRIPPVIAMEMLLTGAVISSERALDLHLVNRVVEQDELLETALSFAREIAAGAPLSVEAHKRIALGMDQYGAVSAEETKWQLSRELVLRARASDDAREGAMAFLEKRQPKWSGS